jgi:hypothetical protein
VNGRCGDSEVEWETVSLDERGLVVVVVVAAAGVMVMSEIVLGVNCGRPKQKGRTLEASL